ncbi:MAG: ABC transporter ATP-binding protein [Bacteroidota bacterium]
MIVVENIKKQFKQIEVLNVEHLEIPKGQSFGLVGNNGAGKTTLFRLVLDLIKPTSGRVTSKGEAVLGDDNWKRYTGSYLDEGFLISFLTPDEYFKFIGDLHSLSDGELKKQLAPFAEVFNDEIIGKKKFIRDLSKGNQKKVGIAAALLGRPEVVVLDEPFANLDPTTQIRLKQLLIQYKTEHEVTLLISSHDLNHVTEVCERIVVLEKGLIVKDMATSASTLKELEEFFTV